VNAAGVPQWIAPLCTAAGAQTSPAIASDGAGGAIVTWNDARSGPVNDIYAQRVNAAGVPQWTIDGVALCTAAGGQHDPTIVADGAGGAIVTWYDGRNGVDMDIYAQRVSAAGVPQWTADGVALCTATGGQYAPTIVTDGAGGAVLTWSDNRNGTDLDIYAQRVSAAGVPQWTADGVALCTAANGQGNPTIVADGTGGAIVTWSDERSVSGVDATNDIYAQRVSASGVPQWTADGVAVCTAAGLQSDPAIVSDGGSGAIVAWHDHRSGTTFDVYAQNVNADGTLGSPGLSVPATTVAAHFGLSRVEPNPSIGALRASISLADDTPAILGVYDLTGRCLESQPLGSLGAGAHIVSLNSNGARWPPGIYELRLEQGTRSAFCKVAIVR
jgi:hypothetical protein